MFFLCFYFSHTDGHIFLMNKLIFRLMSTSSSELRVLNEWLVGGGCLRQLAHDSSVTNTEMRFSVFLPSKSESEKVPVSGSMNEEYVYIVNNVREV